MLTAAAAESVDFWRWQPHPEVWLLVGSLVGLYVYAVRVIGPKAVPPGTPAVTRSAAGAGSRSGIAAALAGGRLAGARHRRASTSTSCTWRSTSCSPSSCRRCCCWPPRSGWPASCVGTGRVDAGVRTPGPPRAGRRSLFNALALLSHWQVHREHTPRRNGLLPLRRAHGCWSPPRCCSGSRCAGPSPSCASRCPAQMIYLFVAVDRADRARRLARPSPRVPCTPSTTSRPGCGASR